MAVAAEREIFSHFISISLQVRDQHGVLRARFQLGQFGWKFLLELCCIRIGGNSCVPAGHISRREVRKIS